MRVQYCYDVRRTVYLWDPEPLHGRFLFKHARNKLKNLKAKKVFFEVGDNRGAIPLLKTNYFNEHCPLNGLFKKIFTVDSDES